MSNDAKTGLRSGTARTTLTAAGVVVVAGVIGVFAAGPLAASGQSGGALSKSALQWPSKKEVACERRGGLDCSSAARTQKLGSLSVRDARGASTSNGGLLTEQQAVASVNWTDTSVDGVQATIGAALMTYGQAQADYPMLAGSSSAVVDPSRQVWVMTRYYTPARTEARDWGFGPAVNSKLSSTEQDPYDSVVIDAATGQETDACQDCEAVPTQ